MGGAERRRRGVAGGALAEIQAAKPEMTAEKPAKHRTDPGGDLSEAEHCARMAGYWASG